MRREVTACLIPALLVGLAGFRVHARDAQAVTGGTNVAEAELSAQQKLPSFPPPGTTIAVEKDGITYTQMNGTAPMTANTWSDGKAGGETTAQVTIAVSNLGKEPVDVAAKLFVHCDKPGVKITVKPFFSNSELVERKGFYETHYWTTNVALFDGPYSPCLEPKPDALPFPDSGLALSYKLLLPGHGLDAIDSGITGETKYTNGRTYPKCKLKFYFVLGGMSSQKAIPTLTARIPSDAKPGMTYKVSLSLVGTSATWAYTFPFSWQIVTR